ncbi:MAG: zinc-binding alcohol dehydrogenase [Anaerolineae bacterium]
MKARAIVFTGVDRVVLQEVEIPPPGEGEVLVEALYTLVSPGTELRCLAGKQEGLAFPFIAGYSLVGRVAGRGPGAKLPLGSLVYCGGTARTAGVPLGWGGHVSHAVQPESNVYPVPQGVDPLWAVAAHVAGIAYRGMRLGRPRAHETVSIVGLGTIGALAARLHALSGARVVAADLSPQRVARAQEAGIEAFVPEGDLAPAFRDPQHGRLPGGADLVVDATGHPDVLRQAIEVARDKPWGNSAEPGPRLVVQGSYPGDFQVPYDAAFRRELTFYVPRDAQPRDVRAVLDLMVRGKLRLDGFAEVRQPEAAARTYADLADPATELLTVAFQWRVE